MGMLSPPEQLRTYSPLPSSKITHKTSDKISFATLLLLEVQRGCVGQKEGFESSARGWEKPLLGEGAIFGAHVRFAGPVCGVLGKTEAVWVRLKYFWSQVKDDVL